MLDKTPSVPQRCTDFAEVRSPRTAPALASSLRLSLSLPTASPSDWRPQAPGFSRPLRRPQTLLRLPLHRLNVSRLRTPLCSPTPPDCRAAPFCSPLYRAGETRFDLFSLTFDPQCEPTWWKSSMLHDLRPPVRADVVEIIDAPHGERTLASACSDVIDSTMP